MAWRDERVCGAWQVRANRRRAWISFSLAARTQNNYLQEMHELEERQTREWVAIWRETAVALEQIKTEELRALTQEEAGQEFAKMTADTDTFWISPERAAAEGLIEQQRLFMLSHEHPACHRRRS